MSIVYLFLFWGAASCWRYFLNVNICACWASYTEILKYIALFSLSLSLFYARPCSESYCSPLIKLIILIHKCIKSSSVEILRLKSSSKVIEKLNIRSKCPTYYALATSRGLTSSIFNVYVTLNHTLYTCVFILVDRT